MSSGKPVPGGMRSVWAARVASRGGILARCEKQGAACQPSLAAETHDAGIICPSSASARLDLASWWLPCQPGLMGGQPRGLGLLFPQSRWPMPSTVCRLPGQLRCLERAAGRSRPACFLQHQAGAFERGQQSQCKAVARSGRQVSSALVNPGLPLQCLGFHSPLQ